MKTISKNIFILSLISLLFLANGCDLEDANKNPNDPTEVPVKVLMPFVQERLADMMGGTTQVMAGIFMQYYTGVDNHPHPIQTYTVNEALYVEWDWNDYYNGPMINLRQMIDLANEQDLPHYSGIGKVLMALSLGNLTSMWGDVPYSEALEGSEILSPLYNNQEYVYEQIQTLLNEAIMELEMENPGVKPAGDDLIFSGNTTKWIQAAWALKARYYIHLSKRASDLEFDPAAKALEAIPNAISQSDDDLEYYFGYSAAESNPFYSFCLNNYLDPNDYFNDLLASKADPRKKYIYKSAFGQATLSGVYFTSANSPVHMMTYHELKFIEAEARLRINANDSEVKNAFEEAIYANMKKLSAGAISDDDINSYIVAEAQLTGDFDHDLQVIMEQKYIAMFSTIESWTDFRRTGYPALTPTEGGDHNQNPGGEIPRRLPYPQTERLYNANFPAPNPNLQERFWWDMN